MASNQEIRGECMANDLFPPSGLRDHSGYQGQSGRNTARVSGAACIKPAVPFKVKNTFVHVDTFTDPDDSPPPPEPLRNVSTEPVPSVDHFKVKNTFVHVDTPPDPDDSPPPPGPLRNISTEPVPSKDHADFIDDEQPEEDKEVLSNVCAFARTQNGSEHLKLMIKCNRSIAKICEKLRPEVTMLAKDPYASEVLSKIFAYPNEYSIRDKAKQEETKSETGTKEGHILPDWLMRLKNDLATALLPDMHVLAMDMEACWVIQEAVANVKDNQILLSLILPLTKYLIELIKHKHANHVIQMFLKILPKEHIEFMMIREIEKKVEEIAYNQCGCRVLQRLLERNDCKDLFDKSLEKIMTVIDSLINHRYGNYVVQHILDWGSVHYQKEIFKAVLSRLVKCSMGQCSMGQFSINVVEKCLKIAYEEQPGEPPNSKMQKLKGELIHKLIVGNQDGSSPISTMMNDKYGNCIVRHLIDWSKGKDRDILFKLFDKETVKPGMTNYANRVLEHYKKAV